ncbi:G patch domain-containing protein 1 [Cloeon dipterum]|uniref:G patch domain-containing protein 1 n=1 Tax=Cloeon dipterum TaxID=197152 RepID=UPI00321FCA95
MGTTEAYTFYGTQLEELTEDELWAKKPVPVEEQVATDKQGRRRFHGAFTGGFSAGYFNTVGSEEGWTPATFRSTRAEKEAKRQQRPEDFMDDEDQEVFGIAPKVLRARQEYKKATIGGHGSTSLEGLLRPVRDTVGVLLLRRMGWRPGQGVGPRQTAAEKRRRRQVAGRAEEEEEPEDDLEGVTFAPDDLTSLTVAPKTNTYGMGYVGLATPFSLFEPPKPVMNAAVGGVRGQAFGVGAFEREDDDIYAADDMSRYDFFLESANENRKRRNDEKRAEIEKKRRHGESKCLENFAEAKEKMATATFYPPPQVPKHFVPKHGVKQTRFSEQKPQVAQKLAERRGRHDLSAEQRGVLVGEVERKTESLVRKPVPVLDFEVVPAELQLGQFNPFSHNPEKLKRYQQYLTLRKMKQTDKLVCLQPPELTEWEKSRELNEFEQAAVLFRPLAAQISDRFVSASTLVGSEETPTHTEQSPVEESVKAAKLKMFGKMTRDIAPWQPCALLCKRFNVPEPNSGVVASGSKKKAGFSVFDFLAAQPAETPKVPDEKQPEASSSQAKPEEAASAADPESRQPQPQLQQLPPPKPREVFTTEKMTVEDKMDLFKSVFLSSSEDEEEPPEEPPPKRRSSPARGVFKSLDLMAPRAEKPKVAAPPPAEQPEAPAAARSDLYGPALPPARPSAPAEASAAPGRSREEVLGRWVEKQRKKEKKSRDSSRSRERKSKKKHKKHKHHHRSP